MRVYKLVVTLALLAILGMYAKIDIKPIAASETRYSVSIPDIAARCKGEAFFAVKECVCTVKERIKNGWSLDRVLWHYYAADATPTDTEIELTSDVLDGNVECPSGMYYMFSSSDVKSLGLLRSNATTTIEHGDRVIYFYPIDTFRRGE